MIVNIDEQDERIRHGVQCVLDETLSLGARAYELQVDSQLLGAIPELDSTAVVNVLMGLEEQFDITIEDDEIDAHVFETLGSLSELIAKKIK